MPNWGFYCALLILTSCGGMSFFGGTALKQERKIASLTTERLLLKENEGYAEEVDARLNTLFHYYSLAQKNLNQLDESLPQLKLKDVYRSAHYTKLLAIKSQVDEVERDLLAEARELNPKSPKSDIQRFMILKERIMLFSKKGFLKSLAMENIQDELGLVKRKVTEIDFKLVKDDLVKLALDQDHLLFEKTLDHLSRLMEVDINSSSKKFKPSENDAGNISGAEFPPKVWSLTFNRGPVPGKTQEILSNLMARNLSASFFQSTENSLKFKDVDRSLIEANMEIASNTFSHFDLSKVGHLSLKKQISGAKTEWEELHQRTLQFLRLPYGSGIDIPDIRELVVKNNFIHVQWNVDSLDWVAQTPDRIVQRTKLLMKKSRKDSGIILFHQNYERSVEASKVIMDYLLVDNRRVCKLETIVKEMNQGQDIVCSQKSF